jgi:hypothetical protein
MPCVVVFCRYNQDNDLEEDVVPNINPSHISWPSDGMHTSNDIPYSGTQWDAGEGRSWFPATC